MARKKHSNAVSASCPTDDGSATAFKPSSTIVKLLLKASCALVRCVNPLLASWRIASTNSCAWRRAAWRLALLRRRMCLSNAGRSREVCMPHRPSKHSTTRRHMCNQATTPFLKLPSNSRHSFLRASPLLHFHRCWSYCAIHWQRTPTVLLLLHTGTSSNASSPAVVVALVSAPCKTRCSICMGLARIAAQCNAVAPSSKAATVSRVTACAWWCTESRFCA